MRAALKLIWTITAAATILQAASGLWQVLLPLRMQAEGLTKVEIGYAATCYGIGFTIGCLCTPLFVRHVGHIRAFAGLAAVSAIVALIFSQAASPWAWIVLRGIAGLSMSGLFSVCDSWTSASATAENRGRVLSIYMIFTKIALILAPLGIWLSPVNGPGLFMTVAALLCLSLLPVCAANTREPPRPNTVRINVHRIFMVAPSAAVGAFVVGIMNGPVTNLAAIFGTSIGMSNRLAATLLLAIQAGSLAMQWPLGVISDRFDRRHVIAGLGFATSLVCAIAVVSTLFGSFTLVFLAIFLWGGIALCIYAVCVAHVCEVVSVEEIVPSVSGLLMIWAMGMAIGPAPASYVMEHVAPWGLFLYAGTAAFLLALFVIWRINFRHRPQAERKSPVIAVSSPPMLDPHFEVPLEESAGKAGAFGGKTDEGARREPETGGQRVS